LKQLTTGVVRGSFDWLRHRTPSVVGGNFYYETSTPVQFQGEPQICCTRDERGYTLQNVRMVSGSRDRRLQLDQNDWVVLGSRPISSRRHLAK
jgi:hypothetical protein